VRRTVRDVTIFYRNTLHSTLNFDLQIFGFRKETGKEEKEKVLYFQAPTGLRMGTFLAPGVSSQRSRRQDWLLGHGKSRVQPRAVGCSFPRLPRPCPCPGSYGRLDLPTSPERERERRLHARGVGAGSTMVPGAAAAAPCPLALRALSSKLSGSAVDKKPGRP
jgi:hypothetical protein